LEVIGRRVEIHMFRKRLASLLAAELTRTGEAPGVIKPFTITRFYENRPVDEKASAGTAH
jgi:hypothetical protein